MTYLDTSHNDAPTEGNNDYRFLSYNILFFFGQFYSDVIKIHLLEPICVERRGNFQNLVRKLAWTA